MATKMLLRTLIRRRLLPSSYSTSHSLSVTAAAACSDKWLTSDFEKPWSSIFPLGKQMASFGRPFSSRPTAGNSTEEKGFDMEGEKEKLKIKGPFEVHYGVADIGGQTVEFDEARVMIFKEYKEKAEAFYGQPLTRFVVIIPANSYDAILHKMIKDAATTAGLDLQRIIVKGPNAGQYPYGLRRRHGDPITTLDFSSSKGYSTTVDYYQNIPEICRQANGIVPDNLLDQTAEFLKLAHGVDITEDPSALKGLSEALERASVNNSKVIIKMPAADGDGPLTERTVTINNF